MGTPTIVLIMSLAIQGLAQACPSPKGLRTYLTSMCEGLSFGSKDRSNLPTLELVL